MVLNIVANLHTEVKDGASKVLGSQLDLLLSKVS